MDRNNSFELSLSGDEIVTQALSDYRHANDEQITVDIAHRIIDGLHADGTISDHIARSRHTMVGA